MSAPGVAIANDGELIRSIHDRLRRIEDTETSRVGEWVFSSVDGVLQAVRPGVEPVVFGEAQDLTAEIQEAVSGKLAGYVSAADLVKSLSGFSGPANSTTDSILEQLNQWSKGLSALGPIVDAITGVQGGLAELAAWALTVPTMINGVLSMAQTGWANALAFTGVHSPDDFVRLLRGFFPPIQAAIDGALHALDLPGIVANANGTWQYVQQQGQNAVSGIIQQADGTIISAEHAVQQMAAGALSAAAPIGQVVAAGQQVVDHGITVLEGGAAQAGQQAQQYAAALANQLGAWVNALTGAPAAPATGPQYTEAQKQAAAAAVNQGILTNSLQSQQAHFYGGHGTAGTLVDTSFSGLTSLPAGFTQIPFAFAAAVARSNTPAVTSSQTVSDIWTVADDKAKYLFLRGTADFSTVVYVKIQSNDPLTNAANCQLYTVHGGVRQTLGAAFTLPITGKFVANQLYTLQATAYEFEISGPNGLDQKITDSGHASYLDADTIPATPATLYVYGGFGTDGTALTQFVTSIPGGVTTYTPPAGLAIGDTVDIIDIGGGGSGSSITGFGGGAGAWNGVTLTFGTDIPSLTAPWSISVGSGDGGGGGGWPGAPGTATTFGIPGYAGNLAAAGGAAAGSPTSAGQGAPDFSWGNIKYSTGGVGSDGAGGVVTAGPTANPGHHGRAYVTPIDTSLPGSLLHWSFYDSGPSAGPATDLVTTSETTTSLTYVDLPTVTDEVTVTIGTNGLALIFISSLLGNLSTGSGIGSFMSFALSGANTLAADDSYSISYLTPGAGAYGGLGAPFLFANLAPGPTTFKLKYRVTIGGTGIYWNRRIAAIPL